MFTKKLERCFPVLFASNVKGSLLLLLAPFSNGLITSTHSLYSGGSRDVFTGAFQCRQCYGPVEIVISTGGLFYLAASGKFSRRFLNFQSVLKFIYIYTHNIYIYIDIDKHVVLILKATWN